LKVDIVRASGSALLSSYKVICVATDSTVSPGHLAWSRGLSASQSAHNFMYINLRHRPLDHQNTAHNTLHNIIYLLPHTAYIHFSVSLFTSTSLSLHHEELQSLGTNLYTRILYMVGTRLKVLRMCSVIGICALGGWCYALHQYTSVTSLSLVTTYERSFTIYRRLTACVQCLGLKRGDWDKCSSRDKRSAGRVCRPLSCYRTLLTPPEPMPGEPQAKAVPGLNADVISNAIWLP
jgi:hypothetical protein